MNKISWLTFHTEALEVSDLVEACTVVLARMGQAFVDVELAAIAHVALRTVTLHATALVDAGAAMVTGGSVT